MRTYRIWLCSLIAAVYAAGCFYAAAKNNSELRIADPEFFKSEEAVRIGDQVLAYQRVTGGWPKNINMAEPMSEEKLAHVLAEKGHTDDSTIDNGATLTQMRYLAQLWQATGEERFRYGFCHGLEFVLSGQYENGGWPQFWPNPQHYQVHITFNDAAIYNTLNLLHDVYLQLEPYQGELLDAPMRVRVHESFDKGIDCTLRCQIRVNGRPTVWCQQHDRETYLPAGARAYELPSFCSLESAMLVALLMELPDPDQRVKDAVHGAMRWFDDHKLTGVRVVRTGERGTPSADKKLVEDPEAEPIWGRFYDLEEEKVFVCDRDGVPRRSLEEIGHERRNGYGWYNSAPLLLYPKYDAWADRHDPSHKEKIDMEFAVFKGNY